MKYFSISVDQIAQSIPEFKMLECLLGKGSLFFFLVDVGVLLGGLADFLGEFGRFFWEFIYFEFLSSFFLF